MVKPAKSTPEHLKLLALIQGHIITLKHLNSLNKLTHDIRKEGNAKKQDKSAGDLFIMANGMKIPEADSGQRRKRVISHTDCNLPRTLPHELVLWNEVIWVLFC
jgi:hypothetical protein